MPNIIKIGGGSKPEMTGNAVTSEVLSGRTFYTTSDELKLTGSMPNKNSPHYMVSRTNNAVGDSGWIGLFIPETGKYYENTYLYRHVRDMTDIGDVGPDAVLNGRTFTSCNGVKLTGIMTNHGAVNRNLGFSETFTIPEGYHNGSGRITAPARPPEPPAQPRAKMIRVGAVSWSYGYNTNTTASLNISGAYSRYRDITVDDIVFPVTASSGWFESYPDSGGSATLNNFRKSYDPSSGVLTITAQGGYNYCNTSLTCDIYVLDRYGV